MKPTTEDVMKIARKVWGDDSGKPWHESAVLHLEAFAKLVAAAEREECAKVCEGEKVGGSTGMVHVDEAINETALACATAIRARGEKNE